MADLYSILPGITPTSDQIQQAELLAVQTLQAQYPDLDLRTGTAVRDLVIQPTAYMMALLEQGLNYYFENNTIAGITNDTPSTILDDILSNWFLTRNLGTYAVISVRLYFARQKNVVLSSSTYFSPDNNLLYYPTASTTIPSTSMSYDNNLNEYYVDVQLQAAAQGTSYNLSSGNLLYFSNFDPYFLSASINYLVTASIAGETNAQFITRASTAISTRNLINNPSIVSNLEAEFNYLTQVVPIGYGDPEMVRDQIQAVFNPETPRLLSNLSSVGTLATATLADHGWYTGQIVTIAGATPSQYNGQYTITVIDASDFSYVMDTTAGIVTVMPTVQSVTTPVLIHNGGMVDVYCDNQQASSVIQLTTDAFGDTILSGPVYSFTRSSTSGGSAADTIPFQATVNYQSMMYEWGSSEIQVAAAGHGLATGQAVTISGLTQTSTITAINCNNLTVTMTVPNHGVPNDTTVEVLGVTPTTYNGTWTVTVIDANTLSYTVSANISGAGSGTMTIVNPNTTVTENITVLGSASFNFPIPTFWTSIAPTGTAVFQYDVPFTVSNPYNQTLTLTSLTSSGTTVTGTLQNHGLTNNRYITVTGATPSGYNGQFLLTSVPNADSFTYEIPSALSSPAGGTPQIITITPWDDVGFSSRQELQISFGTAFANSTASFAINFFSSCDSVQTYLNDAANRVLCADLLARGFNFYVLDMEVIGYAGGAPSSATVQTVAQTYLNGLVPGAIFVMGDLISALSAAGVTSIQTPVTVNYTKYTRDLITPVTGTITDYLDPNDVTNIYFLGTVTTSSASI
jgi:hypothetical protein